MRNIGLGSMYELRDTEHAWFLTVYSIEQCELQWQSFQKFGYTETLKRCETDGFLNYVHIM